MLWFELVYLPMISSSIWSMIFSGSVFFYFFFFMENLVRNLYILHNWTIKLICSVGLHECNDSTLIYEHSIQIINQM